MPSFERYFATVSFLEGLSNLPAQQFLRDRAHPEIYPKRMRYFLSLLGHPERGIRFVHIAGTAGKGSVATMVHEILTAAGERTGLFTSPYTTTSIEKVRVARSYIAPGEFAALVDELKPVIDHAYERGPYGGPSYFEVFFALALLAFRRRRCTWAVLEAGLGGRYDATNAISPPAVSAITNVDLDHTDILGKTLAKIARDKAGIIKRGSIFLTAERRKNLLHVFRQICRAQGARFVSIADQPTNIRLHHRYSLFRIHGSKYRYRIQLAGGHQVANAMLARRIAMTLNVAEQCIVRGLARARIPCRLEIVQRRPLVVIDGAHSVVKMKATRDALPLFPYRRLILVLAIAQDKDVVGMVRAIARNADRVLTTRFQIPQRTCTDPVKLARIMRRTVPSRVNVSFSYDPWIALRRALHSAGKDDLVLITGSLYLAGELRQRWHSEAEILRQRSSFSSGRRG